MYAPGSGGNRLTQPSSRGFSKYLPFAPRYMAIAVVVATLSLVLAGPARGPEDARVDRREALYTARSGHSILAREVRRNGGRDVVGAKNARLDKAVSVQILSITPRSSDSVVVRAQIANHSPDTLVSAVLIDSDPNSALSRRARRPLTLRTPAKWILPPGSSKVFELPAERAEPNHDIAVRPLQVVSRKGSARDTLTYVPLGASLGPIPSTLRRLYGR